MQLTQRMKAFFKRVKVLGRNSGTEFVNALQGSYGVTLGAVAGSLTTALEDGHDTFRRTRITFASRVVPVTFALKYAGTKIYDFPLGRILVLGVTSKLRWAVTSARVSTINDNAAMDWSLGTVTASNVTLAGTMLDLNPKVDRTLDGAVAAYTAYDKSALAASAVFDGSVTPIDAFLNVSFPTATDIDADGTLTVEGFVDIHWVNLGHMS